MKKLKGFFCFIVIICGVFILSGLSVANVSELKKIQVLEGYGKFPLYFIKNQGQVDQKVKFYERGRGHSIFFTSKEIVFSFYSTKDKSPSIVKLTPLGMRKDVDIVAEDHQDGKINYFNGKDSKKWKTNIPTYRTVVYREAYPGIDIKFYGNNQQLEYDILVKKGGDPSQVKFQYSGIENFEVTDKGDLCISLKDGGKVIQKKPIVYQEIEGNRNYLTGKFKLHQIPLSSDSSQSDVKKSTPIKNFVYSFEVASYNKNIPLIIDPVLVYSTYLGGTGDDAMYSDERMTIDSNGNVYITGSTESSDFPTKNPLYPELWGPWDSFVTKINAAGTELVFSTYIGGSNRDTIKDITIDSDGNIFITGETSSDDFPIKNALFPELWGNYDGFVTRIRAAGDSLKFSTYLGGNGSDSGKGIALDPDKNIYVTGQTFSADFPTKNPIYPELWGQSDAFVIKFESDGSEIYYSTYLGGSGRENDSGGKIAVDNNGNVYVTGTTRSSDFPTVNTLYSNLWGYEDAFVTKINSAGTSVLYSTYLGGSNQEWGMDIALDSYGNAYVTGTTFSDDFPTKNALYPNLFGGSDAFVTKIKPDGSALEYSTYLGGNNYEYGNAIAVDTSGAVYVTGSTSSDDYPLENPLPVSTHLQGVNDTYVTKFSPGGTSVPFSTYLGGIADDFGYDIAVDSSNKIYVSGITRSSNFPTKNPLFSEIGGGSDAFVAKIDYSSSVINPTISQTPMFGPPETTFTQSGADFTPNSTATMHVQKPDDTEYPTQSIPIDENGNFEIQYTAPLDKEPGIYTWWVVDGATEIESNEVSYEITELQPAQVTLNLELDPQTMGNVTINPSGEVCETICSYNFESGTEVQLKASADEGWKFDYWDDGVSCNYNNPLNIVMDENKALTAIFAEKNGPCLIITDISVKDAETGGETESGSPAEVEITIHNNGYTATEDTSIFMGVYSIDVQGSDCDQISGEWENGEKLIQAETYDNLKLEAIAPGQSTKITVQHTFFNACYTDRLKVDIVSTETFLCGLNSVIRGKLYDFKPKPNPDAFLNCWLELSSLVAMPILQGAGLIHGDTAILRKGILIKGMGDYKIYKALKERDFKAFGKNLFLYLYDTAELVFETAGASVLSKVMTAIKYGMNEWNHRGCGEAFPSVVTWYKDFMDGIAEAAIEAGYKLWSFTIGSPVDIEVIDINKDTVYVGKFGEEQNSILNSIGFIIKNASEDPAKSVLIAGEGPYTVNLYGTADGVGLFHFTEIKSNGSLVSISYDAIPLTPNTIASISILEVDDNHLLTIDHDGDGTVDQTIQPNNVEILKYPGDLDSDGDIDTTDLYLFRSTLGKCTGDEGFIADADYDEDGCISYADYRIWYGYYRAAL